MTNEEREANITKYRIPRLRVSMVREKFDQSSFRRFGNSKDLYGWAQSTFFADADRELFVVVVLDAKNKLICSNVVSVGTRSQSLVMPQEVFKPALLLGASSLLLTHNHPSGDPAPSREDRECNDRLVQAGKILGIRVLDHIVCGENDYFSFADAGLIAQQ